VLRAPNERFAVISDDVCSLAVNQAPAKRSL